MFDGVGKSTFTSSNSGQHEPHSAKQSSHSHWSFTSSAPKRPHLSHEAESSLGKTQSGLVVSGITAKRRGEHGRGQITLRRCRHRWRCIARRLEAADIGDLENIRRLPVFAIGHALFQVEFIGDSREIFREVLQSERWEILENKLQTFTLHYERKLVRYRQDRFQF